MSEDFTQELGELDVTETPEAGSEPASTTQQGEESIDLESVEHSTANEQREKQLATLMRKVESGELTLEAFPAKQKWAKEEIEKRIAQSKKEQAKAEELDVDAIVERKLREKQDDQELKAKLAELQALSLSKSERDAFLAKYAALRSEGARKSKLTIELAMQAAGIGADRTTMQQPSMSTSSRRVVESPSGDLSIDQIMKLPKEKRIAELKKLSQ